MIDGLDVGLSVWEMVGVGLVVGVALVDGVSVGEWEAVALGLALAGARSTLINHLIHLLYIC